MQPQLPFPPSLADDPPRASARQAPPALADDPPRASARQVPLAPADDPARVSAPQAPPAPAAPVFVRHARARRYVLRVALDGTVRVTIPRWGSKREAAAFAEREHGWIEKQQRRVEERRLMRVERSDAVSAADLRALREQARRELPIRLLELAAQHGLAVSRISIRNQRSRWGSCSRSGHICLNWRLVQMPAMVRDYVLVHELMHLKRMDHSRAFWKLVAAACPAYKKARAWLRSQSAR
jgi:predicted metal-dependent hydrolase